MWCGVKRVWARPVGRLLRHSSPPGQAGAGAVDRIQRGPAIAACWNLPAVSAGMEMTVRFSLKGNGALLGEPRIFEALIGPRRRNGCPAKQ